MSYRLVASRRALERGSAQRPVGSPQERHRGRTAAQGQALKADGPATPSPRSSGSPASGPPTQRLIRSRPRAGLVFISHAELQAAGLTVKVEQRTIPAFMGLERVES